MRYESILLDYFNNLNLDITTTKFGRWIDQKCTPDVVWSISDYVLNYVETNGLNCLFAIKDIWRSEYAQEYIKDEFTKPNVNSSKVKKEYDKFFIVRLLESFYYFWIYVKNIMTRVKVQNNVM